MSTKGLRYVRGSLFDAPEGSILVHACNAKGSWGAGIAQSFRERYPRAFELYKAHCRTHDPEELVGTCFLIKGRQEGYGHDAACLFTSRGYGRRKDSTQDILEATRRAVVDLVGQNGEDKPLNAWCVAIDLFVTTYGSIRTWSSRFNSGKFAVPWEKTEAILEELEVHMNIYDPDVEPPE